jgi:hypothetical protein
MMLMVARSRHFAVALELSKGDVVCADPGVVCSVDESAHRWVLRFQIVGGASALDAHSVAGLRPTRIIALAPTPLV